MAQLLSKQEDFANQPSMLETLIKQAGHECISLPKFHCELNPIDMVFPSIHLLLNLISHFIQYWGWCKYCYQEVPKKTFAEAKHLALEKLNACPVDVQ
jgi:hypothetical protein